CDGGCAIDYLATGSGLCPARTVPVASRRPGLARRALAGVRSITPHDRGNIPFDALVADLAACRDRLCVARRERARPAGYSDRRRAVEGGRSTGEPRVSVRCARLQSLPRLLRARRA